MMQKTSTTIFLTLVSAVMIAKGETKPTVFKGGKCKPDGSMYANVDYCTKFFVCDEGTLKDINCRRGTVWNQNLHTCVRAGSEEDKCTPQHPQRECERRTVRFIPHPTGCQWYYDCYNKPPPNPKYPFEPFQRECLYPLMFDFRHKKCVDYTKVYCGEGRKATKWECEYIANLCPYPRGSCEPCYSRYPSCIGRPDGLVGWFDNADWDYSYIACQTNRSRSGRLWCPEHQLSKTSKFFNPKLKICVSEWEVPRKHGGLEPSCEGKRPGNYTVKETPKVKYSCPGRDLYWCTTSSNVGHGSSSSCVHFGRFSGDN